MSDQKKANDIFSHLKEDHQKVDGLIKELLESSEVDEVIKFYDQIRRELLVHSSAEEAIIYPLIESREKKGEDIAEHSKREHDEIKACLRSFEDLKPAQKEEWLTEARKLQKTVQHHVNEEEGEMFPKMKKVFSEQELTHMFQDFIDAKHSFSKQISSGRTSIEAA